MEGVIFENYRGMEIVCYPSRTEENKDTNTIKRFWMVEAKYNGEVKGSWEYNQFRVEPGHPDTPYFLALASEIRDNGRDLVDKIIEEKINAFK
jgi:hypothetical protein